MIPRPDPRPPRIVEMNPPVDALADTVPQAREPLDFEELEDTQPSIHMSFVDEASFDGPTLPDARVRFEEPAEGKNWERALLAVAERLMRQVR